MDAGETRLASAASATRVVAAAAMLLVSMPAGSAEVLLANDALRIGVDDATGVITRVTHAASGTELLTAPASVPFVLDVTAGSVTPTTFAMTRDLAFIDGQAWDLAWQTSAAGLRVEARIELRSGAEPAVLSAAVRNASALGMRSLTWPVLASVGTLGASSADDRLLLPLATGYVVKDPVGRAFEITQQYPDAYSGAALQVMAYYDLAGPGFGIEARDPNGTVKDLDFVIETSGERRWLVRHHAWDRSVTTDVVLDYPILIRALNSGEWEEAAEEHRKWALLQPWASEGPWRDRPETERMRWLREQTAFATFGIAMDQDQSPWFQAMHDLTGRSVFHVSGFWWPGFLGWEWYGGYDDWSGSRLNPVNLQTIRANGDHSALFLFDLHFNAGSTNWASASAGDPVAPWSPFEMMPDPESGGWRYVCPATPEWQAFHGWRDTELQRLHDPDAAYHDISAGLGRMRCTRTAHGHPNGQGRWMVDGYRAMFARDRAAVDALRGQRVPQGMELISDLFLREMDYYQARSWAGPIAMLEGDRLRQQVRAGNAEPVPLFDFVYHDVGPVRLDGNLKLAPELGDIFYLVAGRTALWGGLPELNYELSALERFPGMTGPTHYETYASSFWVRDDTPYSVDPAKGAFLDDIGAARTSFGTEYLALGQMRRPPRFVSSVSQVALPFALYNHFARATDVSTGVETGQEFLDQGTHQAPSLLASAYASGRGSLGLFLLDLDATAQSPDVEIDPGRHGESFLNYSLRRVDASGASALGTRHGRVVLNVNLPSRRIVMLELDRVDCGADPACLYRVHRSLSPVGLVAANNAVGVASGNAFDDPTPGLLSDGNLWYYALDDGAGSAPLLTLSKTATVRLGW